MDMPFDQEALIRSISVSPRGKYVLLLGAGASASSGIPTSSQCIWEWKREIYLSGNPHLSPSLLADVSLPSVQDKIQKWLDQQRTFPPANDPQEYSYYIEHAYPKQDDRRALFERRFSGAVPQAGYQLLAILQNSLYFQSIWTTNFDGLVKQARKPHHTRPLKEIGLDTSFRVQDLRAGDECVYVVCLHGDYRYDRLQNTEAETNALDTTLRERFIDQVRRQPLIIIGYGGRDESVMKALETAVNEKAQGGELYWCMLRDNQISPRAAALVEKAKSNGYEAHIVPIDGFDNFFVRLARFIYRSGPEAAEVEGLLSAEAPERSPFALVGFHPDDDWIKSNGYPIELPRDLFQLEVDGITSWKELREAVACAPIVAGLLKGKVLAIGELEKITEVFNGRIKSKVERVPLDERDLFSSDTVVVSLLLQALQQSVAQAAGLEPKGKAVLWDRAKYQTVPHGGRRYRAYEAVRLSLNRAKGMHFLNLIPSLHVTGEDGAEAPADTAKELKRQILGRQWNKNYDDALEAWRTRFLGSLGSKSFSYPPGSQNGFVFKLSQPPVLARILLRTQSSRRALTNKPGEVFQAVTLAEPQLVFGSARGGVRPKDVHPLRGLVNDGPYDLELTQAGFTREVRLGVVCPQGHEHTLSRYLSNLTVAHPSVETKSEYLVAYPGFQQAYRIPLRMPNPTDKEWRSLPKLNLHESDCLSGQREIAGAIIRQIDSLVEVASIDVVLVFVPTAWRAFEIVEDEKMRLDLHDFLKAYGAQKGLRTQLLREDTLQKRHQCEVLWWLAQAIYVKSPRTPFVLNTDDPDTVFVGIGYGYPRALEEGGVVLGCCHMYDATGQGLRYQLSRIHDPVWRNRNPYLKKDDAIQVGLQARQLFYETYQRLPRRVVIHKRTPFLKSEREGLTQALQGVSELEMLTIEFEDAWRFIAYNKWRNCTDLFPVKRGTLLVAGPNQCLLWVHGSVRGLIENNKTYYQGKSRIPAPLKVTRFVGHAPVEQIGSEILGLSKMNWNSCDLYSPMPATLESSSAIARVGQLLSRFGPETYDYRLFI
ncbi:MAG: hypothetical protein EWM72_01671 [Nitrospira sp.]|nr:MAG: hypothetical protein EWM72_01671 [Nitrospira sp.]